MRAGVTAVGDGDEEADERAEVVVDPGDVCEGCAEGSTVGEGAGE